MSVNSDIEPIEVADIEPLHYDSTTARWGADFMLHNRSMSDDSIFEEQVVPDRGRPGRTAFRTASIVAIVVVTVLALSGTVWLLANVALAAFKPTAREGFSVEAATCDVDTGGEILLQLTVTATESSRTFRVEPLPAGDLSVLGVATLPAGLALETLSSSELEGLREAVYERERWADAYQDASNTVIALLRSDGSDDRPVRLDRVQLWWSSGEPAFIQDVRMDLQSSEESCSVSLR